MKCLIKTTNGIKRGEYKIETKHNDDIYKTVRNMVDTDPTISIHFKFQWSEYN